jgi:HD-GYP domain-containing protein (c-di-GMP phosphodiesterase class II)
MPNVQVSQVRYGDKLADNAITTLGNILFYKGKVLSELDIEILKSFLVPSVIIELRNGELEEIVETSVVNEAAQNSSSFMREYNVLITVLKLVHKEAFGRQNLSIYKLRLQFEKLLPFMDEYNVLTFDPKQQQVKDYTYHKSAMVGLTSYQLAKWHGMPTKDLTQITLAGFLHDIGLVRVDSDILDKPTKLTKEELEEVRKHTTYGYQILRDVSALNEGAKLVALQHHERENGTGYPFGLKSDAIHIYAKIISVADIFHAMTNQRVHTEAKSPYVVLEQLLDESFGKVDPSLVHTFITKVTQFHNGTMVRLNDQRIGEIVFSDRSHPTRPWVNVNGTIINLAMERKLFIKEVIQK